jgi:hypothetical protein
MKIDRIEADWLQITLDEPSLIGIGSRGTVPKYKQSKEEHLKYSILFLSFPKELAIFTTDFAFSLVSSRMVNFDYFRSNDTSHVSLSGSATEYGPESLQLIIMSCSVTEQYALRGNEKILSRVACHSSKIRIWYVPNTNHLTSGSVVWNIHKRRQSRKHCMRDATQNSQKDGIWPTEIKYVVVSITTVPIFSC